jgi:hypothetical protein
MGATKFFGGFEPFLNDDFHVGESFQAKSVLWDVRSFPPLKILLDKSISSIYIIYRWIVVLY